MTEAGYMALPDDLVEPVLRMENPEWYATPEPATDELPTPSAHGDRLRELWRMALAKKKDV